jgi:uncharacterized membrane protein (UPF0127 family)
MVLKKKKLSLLIVLLIIITLSASLLTFNNYSSSNNKIDNQYNNNPQVCINNNCFQVSLAITEQERQKGLMFVNELKEKEGMLFIFQEESIHQFWMKNTLIPLDIIWINSSLDIVDIAHAYPCKEDESCIILIPKSESLYTLEINANLTDKYNIKIGDKIKID